MRRITLDAVKTSVVEKFKECGSDHGETFCQEVQRMVDERKKRGINQKRIRWILYCNWAYALYDKEIGPHGAHYAFPAVILQYLRALLPRNVKGDLWKDAFQVSMEQFVEAITPTLLP
ncbi:uncharacterized protein [Ptychodera flava]|uniref:uncharacterized protein n=1 Tax=Ptychodera flava TaxID=63121 RepID=UPI00396A59A0